MSPGRGAMITISIPVAFCATLTSYVSCGFLKPRTEVYVFVEEWVIHLLKSSMFLHEKLSMKKEKLAEQLSERMRRMIGCLFLFHLWIIKMEELDSLPASVSGGACRHQCFRLRRRRRSVSWGKTMVSGQQQLSWLSRWTTIRSN